MPVAIECVVCGQEYSEGWLGQRLGYVYIGDEPVCNEKCKFEFIEEQFSEYIKTHDVLKRLDALIANPSLDGVTALYNELADFGMDETGSTDIELVSSVLGPLADAEDVIKRGQTEFIQECLEEAKKGVSEIIAVPSSHFGSRTAIIGSRKIVAKYDYEANGNDVILVSPQYTTVLLEGEEATNFWLQVDHLDNKLGENHIEFDRKLQELIRSLMEKKKVSYIIQVDASSLKKNASKVFLSGVELKEGRVEKLKFTADQNKAQVFSRVAAAIIRTQMPEFRLDCKLISC